MPLHSLHNLGEASEGKSGGGESERRTQEEEKQRIEVKPEWRRRVRDSTFALETRGRKEERVALREDEDESKCHLLTRFYREGFLSVNPFCSQQLDEPS